MRKTKLTNTQKRIKKALLDENMLMSDVADFYDVTPQAVYYKLLKNDWDYFKKAITGFKEKNHFENQD